MKYNKQEKSWILYDVANSAFVLILTASIPVFFRALVDSAGIESVSQSFIVKLLFSNLANNALNGNAQAYEALKTSLFGLSTTISVLLVAFMSPIFGALADYKGMKKKIFSIFLIIGVFCCVLLGVTSNWLSYLALIIIARIGYANCNIFYDSMLVDVTTDERMDSVSSMGYAFGYIGSCIPFVIGIYLILATPFGLTKTFATQLSFIIVAVWWLLFSIPLLKNVKQTHYLEHNEVNVIKILKRLKETLNKIRKNPRMLYFILAYFCYIDGVYTIISMATTYGAEVGIDTNSMIVALLVTQVVAFPFAIITAHLVSRFKTISLLKVFVLAYAAICIYAYQMDQAYEFWILCIAVAMFMGGIQSLSRAYFGKLVPKQSSNEYFGFFDIFGKFADFFGPLIITVAATIFGQSKVGILGLILLFGIGYLLLRKVAKLEDTL